MRTVGTILKEAREAKGWSIEKISRETKIKEKFLFALEESDWSALPNLTVASGFVRSYAQVVGVDPELTTALIRRDFPPTASTAKAKEQPLGGHRIWTPQNTVAAALIIVVLLIALYLGRQYFLFVAPPSLKVETQTRGNEIVISGKTAPNSTVEVNSRSILLEKDGTFSVSFD